VSSWFSAIPENMTNEIQQQSTCHIRFGTPKCGWDSGILCHILRGTLRWQKKSCCCYG